MYILTSDSLRTFFGIGQGDSLLCISRPLHTIKFMQKANTSNNCRGFRFIILTMNINYIYIEVDMVQPGRDLLMEYILPM
jgi:hypothetical protein